MQKCREALNLGLLIHKIIKKIMDNENLAKFKLQSEKKKRKKKSTLKLCIEESKLEFFFFSKLVCLLFLLFCLRLQSLIAFFHMLIKFRFVSLHG